MKDSKDGFVQIYLTSIYLEISIGKEFITTKIIKEDLTTGIEAKEDVKEEKKVKKKDIFSITISLSGNKLTVRSIPENEGSLIHDFPTDNEEFDGIERGVLALDEVDSGTVSLL